MGKFLLWILLAIVCFPVAFLVLIFKIFFGGNNK